MQLSLFAKQYTMNRLPGQAEKPSTAVDIEKGQVAGDKGDEQDLDPNAGENVDRVDSAETQDVKRKSSKVSGDTRLPELDLKAQP